MTRGELGCIVTPRQHLPVPFGARWCADNGAFGKGFPGELKWFRWLESGIKGDADPSRCLFAVAPDVVGDAAATIARSARWLPRIRRLGLPAAFVAQDGLEELHIPWATFDVLFIGGSTEWKLGEACAEIVREAVSQGIPVHMGRVNSGKRMAIAKRLGCESCDGTFLTFAPDGNIQRVWAWYEREGIRRPAS